MKYVWIIGLLGVAILSGCTQSADTSGEILNDDSDIVIVDMTNDVDDHSVVYDVVGTYAWTTPCADCPGIDTSLELSDDMTYSMSVAYQDRDVTPETTTGTYSLDGDRVILSDTPLSYKIGEDTLTQLDMTGNEISGSLADRYILTR